MADAIHRTTLILRESIDATGLDPVEWLIYGKERAGDIPALRSMCGPGGVPARHRKIVSESVVEMTPAEKDAVDADMLANERNSTAAAIEAPQSYEKAFAQIMLDDRNLLAQKITAILNAIDGAATLAQMKAAVALIPDPPQYTLAQLKTALRNKLDGG